MEVYYSRELNHNYMIIKAPEPAGGYECRMLSGNTIEGLLKFRVRQLEEGREFCYEITSRQPLNRVLEKRRISGGEIRELLTGVSAVIQRIEVFLLREEQLLLDPQYIYVDPDRFSVGLCLLPGYSGDISCALSELLQFLLERADHQEREAIVLAYNLYQASLKENYGIADLMKSLAGTDRIFSDHFSPEIGMEPEEELDSQRAEPAYEEEEESFYYAEENGDGTEKKTMMVSMAATALKSAVAAAGASAVFWYLTGKRGIILVAFFVAVMVVSIVVFWRRGQKGSKEEEEDERYLVGNTLQEPLRGAFSREVLMDRKTGPGQKYRELMEQDKSEWEFYPDSEARYRKEKLEQERERIDREKEAGTTLLSCGSAPVAVAVLEPLDPSEERIEISYVPFIIGKNGDLSDYCLLRPTVSRLHARIDKREEVCILTDLNSTNGTAVNGYILQSNETVSLKNGDEISLADVRFRFLEWK